MNSRRTITGLALGVLAINLFVYALTGLALYQSRVRHERQARQATQNLARTLAVNVSGIVDKVDVGLFSVVKEAERQLAGGALDGPRLNLYLHQQREQVQDFEGMWVADGAGDIRWGTSLPTAQPVSVRDRDYFQRLREDPAPALFLSRPVMGRITRAWSLMAAKRINRPDGAFAGVALGSLRIEDYFFRMFAPIQIGAQGTIQLRDGQMSLVTGYRKAGGRMDAPGSAPLCAQDLDRVKASPVSGSFEDPGRITSYQRVGSHPLYVFVSQGRGDYLAPWRLEAALTLSLVGVFTLLTVLIARIGGRISAEKALANEKALLETIFDSLPDALLYVDLHRRVLTVNPAFTALFGYRAAELAGRTTEMLYALPEDYERQGARRFNPDVEAAVPPDPVEFRAKDGRLFPGEITGTMIRNADGSPMGFIGVIRDISERWMAEAKQAKLQGELNHLHRMESIGRLASGVAHDMNNVLAAILSVTEVLRVRSGEHQEFFDMILDAIKRGRNLVKGLMAFARKDVEETEYVDLNALVQKEAELLATTMLQRIQLELDLAPKLPRIFGSATALATALMNLCVNAMDAMPEGGTLTLRTARLDAQTVELTVQDTGQGMPPEVAARAFEPFYTTKPVGKGTGLGLSLVFGTIQAHGGSIAIRSEVGRGTEVRITLPVVAGDGGPAEPAALATAQGAAPRRLLLVDDDTLVRNAAASLLASLGHQVTTAGGGYEALGMLEFGSGWDLVVLDLNMPGLDGLETLKRLRRLKPDLPVLLATGYADDQVREALKALAPVAILPKPYSVGEFQSAAALQA